MPQKKCVYLYGEVVDSKAIYLISRMVSVKYVKLSYQAPKYCRREKPMELVFANWILRETRAFVAAWTIELSTNTSRKRNV